MNIITKKIDNKIIFYDKDVGINIEELFSSLKKEKKKAEPKKQKELLLKPEEEVKEKEQTVSEVLQDELEPIGSDTSIIGQVTKKLSEMKVNKSKVDKTYKSVLNHMRKVVKKLNDDEMYEVTTQLKKWFNKNIM